MQEDIAGKELELLKAAFPGVERVAVLVNPGNPTHAGVLEAVQRAARTVRTELLPVEVRAPDQGDLDRFRDDGPPWVERRHSRFAPPRCPHALKAVVHCPKPDSRRCAYFSAACWSAGRQSDIIVDEGLPLL